MSKQQIDFKKVLQMFDRQKANTTGISQSTGIVSYNLEAGAKMMYPVITPLRNKIPRVVSTRGDMGVKWKAIIAINPGGTPSSMREGRRSGYIDQTEVDFSQNFATEGLENFVTDQATWADDGFDDVLAIGQTNLLNSVMISEEILDLGGNQSKPFGTTATPVGTLATGGSLATGTALICKAVALTLKGYNLTMAQGQVIQTQTRTNGDGTSDVLNAGAAIISAASASVTPTGTTQSIAWKTTAKPGAFGYAWFVGTTSGNLVFQTVTGNNLWTQTTLQTSGQLDGALTATDYSANPYDYDGLVTTASSSGAYLSNDGANLTADGSGGVYELDAFLASFYIKSKVSPTAMWMGPLTRKAISRKIMQGPSGSGASLFKIELANGSAQANMTGGTQITEYNNTFAPGGNQVLPMKIHPNLPEGKIFFDCDQVPYPLNNCPVPYRKLLRKDYWSNVWPKNTFNTQFGVYFDGLMQVYAAFTLGVFDNIGLN